MWYKQINDVLLAKIPNKIAREDMMPDSIGAGWKKCQPYQSTNRVLVIIIYFTTTEPVLIIYFCFVSS